MFSSAAARILQRMQALLPSVVPSSLQLWLVPQQRFLASLNGHTNWVRSCRLSPDARVAVSGGDDHSVRVWDLETQAALHTFNEMEGSVQVVRFHPNGGCRRSGAGAGPGSCRGYEHAC